MKRLLACIWHSLVRTLLYMALGSPLTYILYMLLLFMEIESILVYIVVACVLIIFFYNLYSELADKPREENKK